MKKPGKEESHAKYTIVNCHSTESGFVAQGSWHRSLGLYLIHLFIILCVCMCTYACTCVCQGGGVAVRGQFTEVGSVLPPCGSRGLNLGPQSWWQVPSAAEPSHCPSLDSSILLPSRLLDQAPRRQAHATSLESFCPGAGITRVHTFKEFVLYAKQCVCRNLASSHTYQTLLL